MSEVHEAAAPRQKRAYTPRQTNAERAESRHEAVLAAVPRPSADLRERAERQAKAAKLEAIQKHIDAMDEMTPEPLRRAAMIELAKIQNDVKAVDPEVVWVTVRQRGAGKISMGEHVPQVGDAFFDKGERLTLVRTTADDYEERGWVDIDGHD